MNHNISPEHVLLQPSGECPIKWYEPAERARELLDQFPDFTFSHLEWPGHTDVGGYEIHYITQDFGTLCHQCSNKELHRTIDPDDDQFYIVASDVHWEAPAMVCDHCGREIESEYGDPDVE